MSSKAGKLVKGSMLRTTEFFANAIIGLIMMPFIIHSLGDKMYGLWVFVGSFMGYYGLMDFGLNTAVQRFISKAIGLRDDDEINKVVNTTLFIFAIIGAVALIISLIVAFLVPMLIKNITEVEIFRKLILILGFNFAVGFPLRVFSGVLAANIRYDLNGAVEIIKIVFRTILIIFFLKNGYGIMALAAITFFIDIGGYISKYFIVMRLYKYITISKELIDKSKIKSLFNYSIYTFIAQIADQLRFNIDNLVIVTFIGLNPVTLYSIAARLIRYCIDFITATIGVLMPVFSHYESIGDYNSIREKFTLTTKISSYLSILIGGALIIFGRCFIERWMGGGYAKAYPILIILLVPAVFALMQSPTIQLLQGISKHKFFAMSNFFEGLANLILSIIFVKKYGLAGVALGTAIPMIIIKLVVQPTYTCYLIKIDVKKYYFDLMVPLMLKSITILLVFWLIFKNFIIPNYLSLFFLAMLFFILFLIFIFYFGFSREEREVFNKAILPPKKNKL